MEVSKIHHVNEKINNMKYIIILLFLATQLTEQDIEYRLLTPTDSTYQVQRIQINEDGSEDVSTTLEMDSTQVKSYILGTTLEKHQESDRRIIRAMSIDLEGQQIKKLINLFDTSYFQFTKQLLINEFQGNYILRENGERIQVQIRPNARLKDDTRTGAIRFQSRLSFEVRNFFTTNITFYREDKGVYVGYDENEKRIILKRR